MAIFALLTPVRLPVRSTEREIWPAQKLTTLAGVLKQAGRFRKARSKCRSLCRFGAKAAEGSRTPRRFALFLAHAYRGCPLPLSLVGIVTDTLIHTRFQSER